MDTNFKYIDFRWQEKNTKDKIRSSANDIFNKMTLKKHFAQQSIKLVSTVENPGKKKLSYNDYGKDIETKGFNSCIDKILEEKSMNIEISNGRNCKGCNKSNVCKYQESVSHEVANLITSLKEQELPLLVNINCKEYSNRSSALVR